MDKKYKCIHCGGTGKLEVHGPGETYTRTCRDCRGSGLSSEGGKMINLIRGCVLRSFLINEEKKKLCHSMDDLEEYLDGEEE